MIKIAQRLEFEDIFPEEEKKEILEYLSKAPRKILLKTIGYFNTRPLPNFDNFFSNPELQEDIFKRVVSYSKNNGINKKPELISRHGCLKLTELILSNKDALLEENENSSVDSGELGIFK